MTVPADWPLAWQIGPLVLAISLVFSATRHENWSAILGHAAYHVFYVLGFIAIAYGLVVLVALDLHWIFYVPVVAALTYFMFFGGSKKQPKEKI